MKQLIWAAIILQFGVSHGFGQSVPLTTPSTPPVTTPPAPGEHPPAGGPGSPAPAEPANVIDKPAKSLTETQAKSRLRADGYRLESDLTKGDDGIWRGTAVRDGEPLHVAVDITGAISTD